MKNRVSKMPVAKKHNRRKVEDGILTYLQGGTCNTDVEFGETSVSFRERKQYERGLGFKKFSIGGVHYNLAVKDDSKMTITYLFH